MAASTTVLYGGVMSDAGIGLLILFAMIGLVTYATARANRVKLQRETNARLAAMQQQLDAISDAVGVGAAAPPMERVLVAERIVEPN